MSVQLVINDHYQKLCDILENASNTIKIISPFINTEMAKLLCSCRENHPEIQCEITTRFKRDDFLCGASSIDAIKLLIQAGVKAYALRGLHTKLYLVDNDIGMLGSANFTTGGFRFNHEMSVLFHDDPAIVTEMHVYYDTLLNDIRSQTEGIITLEKVEQELDIIRTLARNRTDKNTKYRNDTDYGATVKNESKMNIEPTPDTIQKILSLGSVQQYLNTIWIKFEGTANERTDSHQKYELFRINNDSDIITCFPVRPDVHDDDYFYLAVVSSDKEKRNTPMIMGRCRAYKAERASEDLLKEHAWMKRYPYFCRLRDMEYLDTQIVNGISVFEMLSNIGSDCFPSTEGTKKTIAELVDIYRQASHRRITARAKEYLDSQFEQLSKVYPVVKA